jgi:hypothetical protein
MRKCTRVQLTLFAIFYATSVSASDKYKVIKVIGSIVVKETGASLSSGDEILATDLIVFKTPDAKASVISSQKGRLILSASNPQVSNSAVKTNLLPPIANISSRAGAIINQNDLRNHFSGKILLLNEVRTQIHAGAFPMNQNSFFYLSYPYQAEAINKQLHYRHDTLLIVENELFRVDGNAISYPESTAVKLNYMDNKKSMQVAEFEVVVPENQQLVKEVQMIIDASPAKRKDQVTLDVLSYLDEFYGRTDADNLGRWLKKNFKSF